MRKILVANIALLSAVLFFNSPAHARDQIHVVGSSTVYPFTTVVGEEFGKRTQHKTPIVESTGTGGGFKLFCNGVGVEFPDFINASRAIKNSEVETCKNNNVTVTELKIGYDGIVFANSKNGENLNVTLQELFLALAKRVPVNGEFVDNPYTLWSDINPDFPQKKIEVLGPPPTSGTRDAFLELVMEPGSLTFDEIRELKKNNEKEFKTLSHSIREDGIYIEAGENDNLIIQKLVTNTNSFGIFGFSFLEQNLDKIKGNSIENVNPEFENIVNGSYPVSRSLFVYAKNEHMDVIPGMKDFIRFYLSEAMTGDSGALSARGLVPLSPEERNELYTQILNNLN